MAARSLATVLDHRMTNEEDDREFRDFIESVSVTKEALAAIVRTLEFSSIHDVEGHPNVPPKRTHAWDSKNTSKPAALSGDGDASRPLLRLAVVRSNPD